ncbi:hypothetical protein [Nocardioides terrigena]|uniref:hypothetical protein n=1 Tax=Nocardioides terrigena TaxID=424797 RepID=UPI000D326BA9|nr:hypothetical protein [Nocardioides terrigena]
MISTIRTVSVSFIAAVALAVGLTTVGIAPATAAPGGNWTTVAKTAEGKMKSKIVGETSTGRKVTGSFKPKKFVEKNGTIFAKGVIRGTFETKSGATKKFKVKRLVPVKKIEGTPVTARALNNRADCDVLNLVLGPLDLNVLGLTVSLNRVLLDVVAVSGAGNLLGNLLCAVAGLLDGGGLLSNLLGQITDLLNQILGRLGLPA